MFDSRNLRLLAPLVRRDASRSTVHSYRAQRSFSVKTSRHPTSPGTHHRPREQLRCLRQWQQRRQLSLFGWSLPKPADAAAAGIGDANTLPDANLEPALRPAPIRALDNTSEMPASANAPHTPEPQYLHDLTNSIAAPHSPNATSTLHFGDELTAVPERIGYLKDVCGLDYGWGPTAIIEWLTEHAHLDLGLSWPMAVVAGAVLMRIVCFRFAMQASDEAIKIKKMNPHLQPLKEEYNRAAAEKDMVKVSQLQLQMRTLRDEYNVKFNKVFLPLVVQLPVQFGSFRLFRGMSELPVPALQTEQFLWLVDLSQSDSFFLLPVVSAGSLYLNLRLGSETGAGPMSGDLARLLRFGIPALTFAFMFFQPGLVQIFFATGSVLALGQASILRSKFLRRILRLLPTPPPAPKDGIVVPGGLRTFQHAKKSTDPVRKDSGIDRFVDSAKGSWKTATFRTEDKLSKRKKDDFTLKAEKYEAKRKQELEWERDTRNKSKLGQSRT